MRPPCKMLPEPLSELKCLCFMGTGNRRNRYGLRKDGDIDGDDMDEDDTDGDLEEPANDQEGKAGGEGKRHHYNLTRHHCHQFHHCYPFLHHH